MDSDDLSRPDRCEKQLSVFDRNPDISIVSGTVEEFSVSPETVEARRILPEKQKDILTFAKKRNPFNHPCVMYRRSAVEAAGGYQDFYLLEDYYLWVRMLQNGCQGMNLQTPLLWMRAGSEMYRRRAGRKYAARLREKLCQVESLEDIFKVEPPEKKPEPKSEKKPEEEKAEAGKGKGADGKAKAQPQPQQQKGASQPQPQAQSQQSAQPQKKKENKPHVPRQVAEKRVVDTRGGAAVNIEKYNEKFEDMAGSKANSSKMRSGGSGNKEKIKSQAKQRQQAQQQSPAKRRQEEREVVCSKSPVAYVGIDTEGQGSVFLSAAQA